MFQKEFAKLVTCRNVTGPNFSAPCATDRYSLINQPWKNSLTNLETTLRRPITTDHKLLVASLTLKLARKQKNASEKTLTYRPPSHEQLEKYDLLVSTAYEHQQVIAAEDPFEKRARILPDAAAKAFTPVPAKQQKPYISEETWQLLCDKQDKN